MRAGLRVLGVIAGIGFYASMVPHAVSAEIPSSLRNLLQKNPGALQGVPEKAALNAFGYYDQHEGQIRNRDFLTIVDYTVGSSKKRLHVFDLKSGAVEHFYAAHGKNTGDEMATQFSNRDGSLQSSLGIYLTAEQYQGDNGNSMKLDGMEETNSNARSRTIVFHSSHYVTEAWLQQYGQMGRSWGCIVVDPQYIDRLIAELEGGSVLYVYGNQR